MSEKIKKSIYKRGWFIALALAVVVGLGVVGATSSGETLTERVDTELAKKEQEAT